MSKAPKLMFPQTCMTANFYDAACDYPKESFAQITDRLLGTKGFPQTENADSFKRECGKASDLGTPVLVQSRLALERSKGHSDRMTLERGHAH